MQKLGAEKAIETNPDNAPDPEIKSAKNASKGAKNGPKTASNYGRNKSSAKKPKKRAKTPARVVASEVAQSTPAPRRGRPPKPRSILAGVVDTAAVEKKVKRALSELPPVAAGLVLSAAQRALGNLYGEGTPDEGATTPLAEGARQVLTENVKLFIIIQLAYDRTPREVARSVRENFDITIAPGVVERYDPTKVHGQTLRDDHKRLYAQARREYQAVVRRLGIADQDFRLMRLHSISVEAHERGAVKIELAALEQAAREVGGMYVKAENPPMTSALLAKLLGRRPEDLPPIVKPGVSLLPLPKDPY
ncbi:MAG: DUF2280 domain-containing protein [Armatimonadetes bacterium]|nr:DUF2280 domain-containing protein [Armatimonadota bacterium]